MKKELTILILLFLLIAPLTLAEDNIAKQTTGKLSEIGKGINNNTENILEKEVPIPQILKAPSNFVFGIKEGASWQELIITLGIWIGFFILILNILGFMPFLNEDYIKVLASIIITTLVSITGALNKMAIFFFDVAGFFKWTASWRPLQIIVAVLMAAIVILTINWLSHMIRNKMQIEKAEEIGEKIKEGSESAEVFSEGLDKFSYSHMMRRGGEKSTRGRFVSRKATERYSKMFGDEQAKKRFDN